MRSEQRNSKKKIPESRKIGVYCRAWTETETKALIEGVRRFGTNYERIQRLVKTKNLQQVETKVYCHAGSGNRKCRSLFPDLKLRKDRRWTAGELKSFWRVIEDHGVNIEQLKKAIPTRALADFRPLVKRQTVIIKANPEHKYAHLL